LGEHNKVLIRKKFSRGQLLAYTSNLPSSLIGLEACAGAHFMGTALQQGYEVRLIPAQFIKPYRKSNKNDFIDAEAIAEAVTKEKRQQQLQSLNPEPAPECLKPENATNLFVEAGTTEAGPTAGTDQLPMGRTHWQCCIHPWMRMDIVVH
jgi:hypothetical protein